MCCLWMCSRSKCYISSKIRTEGKVAVCLFQAGESIYTLTFVQKEFNNIQNLKESIINNNQTINDNDTDLYNRLIKYIESIESQIKSLFLKEDKNIFYENEETHSRNNTSIDLILSIYYGSVTLLKTLIEAEKFNMDELIQNYDTLLENVKIYRNAVVTKFRCYTYV